MAEIEWKGVVWRAAYGDHSVKDLLTILKGFGPMEIVEFEKPGCFRGEISLALTPEGKKQITLYHLEVLGPKRKGQGRMALQWLKATFREGEVHVEDPGKAARANSDADDTLFFWIGMFREGIIDALCSDRCILNHPMTAEDLDEVEQRLRNGLVDRSVP